MRLLIFDNYDSFTYNLVHLVEKITGTDVTVYRNDEVPLEKLRDFDKIILSPGPGLPEESGLLLPLIETYAAEKPILGVCLGQQAIAQAFGGSLHNLAQVYHGVATPVRIVSRAGRLFEGLPDTFPVGRYHSWVVDEKTLPESLEITARDEQDYIMALQHRRFDVCSVQFHPESVLTPDGERMMRNWLKQ
ncbi:aminodeoxychorismate/anthranilate synthase component II [Compostibacter hankyongensis]|uniref:Aminodeoxychorismate/anthranilate synthase component II n=1 Tax=Compostibacter hankyongensis TaxID=1007089 RepID=A0ABP8FX90_9BACT